MKKIKNVKVTSACIGCGTCAALCPDVFRIDSVSQVKQSVNFDKFSDCIREAVEVCPVGAIELIEGVEEDE